MEFDVVEGEKVNTTLGCQSTHGKLRLQAFVWCLWSELMPDDIQGGEWFFISSQYGIAQY